MGLSEYNQKRRFNETPEPEGKKKSSGKGLRFVVQKHDASSLHYDFRLEMEGVLKSWAVPKGPSLNPADKRLAMMVEDHPLDYRNFEGIIPEGNYGGGTVIIWDEGTYESAVEETGNKKQETSLLEALEKGNLKIVLKGKKLNGEFALFQMKGRGENAWILMKKEDEFSSKDGSILNENKSIRSGKTILEMAASNGVEPNHPDEEFAGGSKKSATVKKAETKSTAAKKTGSKKEAPVKTASKKAAAKKMALKASTPTTTSRQKAPGKMQVDPEEVDTEITLKGKELQLTNLNKLYWKKEKFSKGDMINYYLKVAPFMVPYLKDRPHSLNRHPNGIGEKNFFQKDVKGKVPEWIETHADFSESTNETVNYLVCRDEASLIYMANMGCIEINPWHSRTDSPLAPDWCLIDLDPSDTNSFEEVMNVAKVVGSFLDSIKVESCIKTSGSTGIHIYIPLGGKYSYDQSKTFAELLVNLVQQELPKLTSVERSPAKRKGKIYLDFLQNRETQTAAAPYSMRPKPGMPVSTPLHWDELKKGLTPTTWNALNIMDRLKTEGDLFTAVLKKGVDLEKALNSLSSLIT